MPLEFLKTEVARLFSGTLVMFKQSQLGIQYLKYAWHKN
jgi:hypothetical protein